MVAAVSGQGYYSILRWRRDITRDEARNVAVILVDTAGQFAALKHAPLSTVSPRLQDQGLLDAMLVELEKRLAGDDKLTLDALQQMSQSLQHSLYLTEPAPTATPDADRALSALYRAYVAPHSGGSSAMTKGRVLDRVVTTFRRQGFEVGRCKYFGDYLFDAVIESPEYQRVVEVVSFAGATRNWAAVENDAGHFLYALQHVDRPGLAVIQPPAETSQDTATKSYERIRGWFQREAVETLEPDALDHIRSGPRQLALL